MDTQTHSPNVAPSPADPPKKIGKLDKIMLYVAGGAILTFAAYTAANDGDLGKAWAALKHDATVRVAPAIASGFTGAARQLSGDQPATPGIPADAQPLAPAISAPAIAAPVPSAVATYDEVSNPALNPPPTETTIALLTIGDDNGAIYRATPECRDRNTEAVPFTPDQYTNLLIRIDGGTRPDVQSVIEVLGRPYCRLPSMGSGGDRMVRIAWIGDRDGVPHLAIAAFRGGSLAQDDAGAPFLSLMRIERVESQWQEASQ